MTAITAMLSAPIFFFLNKRSFWYIYIIQDTSILGQMQACETKPIFHYWLFKKSLFLNVCSEPNSKLFELPQFSLIIVFIIFISIQEEAFIRSAVDDYSVPVSSYITRHIRV